MTTDRLARIRVFLFAIAAMAACGAAGAEDRDTRLDRLFAALSGAGDETAARDIEAQIWQTWLHTGDDGIDVLMREALERRSRYDLAGALESLDELIEFAPAYAEAWNQRATVYFQMQRYENSLVDVAEALKREPRHFGALAGRGVIRLQQGRIALAYQNILAAMEIHPFLKERYLLPESLREGTLFDGNR